MNQLFIVCCIISTIISIAITLHTKVGFWWALTLFFTLPILLFLISVILLIVGGDR